MAPDAIVLPFERVLKTICDRKGIAYNPQKDTGGVLITTRESANLFPSFYAEAFMASGAIRNNLGSAHGRGPSPPQKLTDHAQALRAGPAYTITSRIE